MNDPTHSGARLLLLDTCGERASVALLEGDNLISERVLEERTASTALQGAIRGVLALLDGGLRRVDGIGVVHGPGSFTGVRVGVAVAKGLCEAGGLPVAAVSRLAVLGQVAGLNDGFALLEAGRREVYTRRIGGGNPEPECMVSWSDFAPSLRLLQVAVISPSLAQQAAEAAAEVRLVELTARHALSAVRACFAAGGSDLATLDGNYVRAETSIYQQSRQAPPRLDRG